MLWHILRITDFRPSNPCHNHLPAERSILQIHPPPPLQYEYCACPLRWNTTTYRVRRWWASTLPLLCEVVHPCPPLGFRQPRFHGRLHHQSERRHRKTNPGDPTVALPLHHHLTHFCAPILSRRGLAYERLDLRDMPHYRRPPPISREGKSKSLPDRQFAPHFAGASPRSWPHRWDCSVSPSTAFAGPK